MPYPLTSVLDDFNRANEDPLGSPWTNTQWYSTIAGCEVISNKCEGKDGAGQDVWPTTFGANSEVFFTAGPPGVGESIILTLGVRLTDIGPTTTDGYALRLQIHADGTMMVWRILKLTNIGETILANIPGSSIAGPVTFGLTCIGTRLTAWRDGVLHGDVDDSTYTSEGKIALLIHGGGYPIDDFGGGNVPLAPAYKVSAPAIY